jgi:hypothetical protein
MSSSRVHRGRSYEPPADSKARSASLQEDRLIQLIEAKGTIKRYMAVTDKIADGTLGVPDFFKKAALDAAIVLADIMLYGENDKVKLEAARDILDRAGHGKTQKVAVSGHMTVDHDTSKLELMNLILASARRAGIKVKDDTQLLEDRPAGQTIDVAAEEPEEVEIAAEPPEGA